MEAKKKKFAIELAQKYDLPEPTGIEEHARHLAYWKYRSTNVPLDIQWKVKAEKRYVGTGQNNTLKKIAAEFDKPTQAQIITRSKEIVAGLGTSKKELKKLISAGDALYAKVIKGGQIIGGSASPLEWMYNEELFRNILESRPPTQDDLYEYMQFMARNVPVGIGTKLRELKSRHRIDEIYWECRHGTMVLPCGTPNF